MSPPTLKIMDEKFIASCTAWYKKAVGTWTKEVICLKDCNQETSPSTEEKIELAQLNLGLRKLVFSAEGDANHIMWSISYTGRMWRLHPDAYACIRELSWLGCNRRARWWCYCDLPKDILRQAKLYIWPLQCDIPEERLKLLNKEAKEVMVTSKIMFLWWDLG